MIWDATLAFQIVEHTKINEYLEEIAENLIVEHLFYTVSIATTNRTPGIFSIALIVKRVWLLGTPEYDAHCDVVAVDILLAVLWDRLTSTWLSLLIYLILWQWIEKAYTN